VVLKGIEPDVTAKEVIDALKEKGFSAKNVSNVINRKKEPQPLFRVVLEPDCIVLKKNEVHPIYNLQYLLHRRINVEESSEYPKCVHLLAYDAGSIFRHGCKILIWSTKHPEGLLIRRCPSIRDGKPTPV